MSQELDLTATVDNVPTADAEVQTVELHTTFEGQVPTAFATVVEGEFSATVAAEDPGVDAQFGAPEIFVVGSALLGPQGPPGPPGGEMVSGWWNYNVSVNPPPKQGEIRTSPDAPAVGQQMVVFLSNTDNQGLYWSAPTVVAGDEIILRGTQGSVLHSRVVNFEQTAVGTDGYATVDTILTSAIGQIARNAQVNVALVRQPTAEGGGGSDVTYVHNQVVPSDVWTIDHNLGKYASIMVVDSGGTTLEPDIHYNSSVQVTVMFGSPTSGKAYLN